jgi:hypothetical protein
LISASSHKPRLARFAILAVTGVTALSIAACSSSNKSSPTTSPISPSTGVASPPTTSSAPAPPKGEAQVRGLIASVAGNAAQVTQQNGNATVDFTGSTKVTEVTPAALTDITTGSCVSVRPQEEGQGGQPITARSVRVSPAVDGKCPQGRESAPGSTTPVPAKRSAVEGAVASVAGTTINVTSTDASGNATQTAVTVTDKTKYTRQGAANTQAISAGKCMTAKGTRDSGGALQATTIDLRPAHDGKCPGEAKPHGHGG